VVTVNPYLWVNDAYALIKCAINGMGIIKIHDYFIKEQLQKGELIEIYSEYSEPDHPIYLYYQPNRYLEPKIRKFIDFFVEPLKST
jgi:DNA-binding transcriptional LysR family regulator